MLRVTCLVAFFHGEHVYRIVRQDFNSGRIMFVWLLHKFWVQFWASLYKVSGRKIQ